ncbi:MAG: MATE family efflux transporter [Lachnospiraceae bacterium]
MNRAYEKDNIIVTIFWRTLFVMIIAELAGSLSAMLDGIIIARNLNEYAIAAHGLVTPYLNIQTMIGCFFATGMQVGCAQKIAQAKSEEANQLFSTAAVILAVIGVVGAIIVTTFSTPIAFFLGAGKDTVNLLPMTSDYLKGLAMGLPVTLGTILLIPIVTLDGGKKRITVAINVMLAANIAGDLLNVFLFKGAMFGMAFATSVGYLFSFVILLGHFRKNKYFRIQRRRVKLNLLAVLSQAGMPSACKKLFAIFRTYFLNMIFVTFASTSALVANSLVQNNIKVVLICIAMAIGSTTLSLTGVLYGEEDKRGLYQLFRSVVKISFGPCVLISLLVFIFAPNIVSVFGSGAYTADTILALRIFIIGFPFIALKMFYVFYFQGSTNKKLSYYSSFAGEMAFVVILAFVLVRCFGTIGLWIAYPLNEIAYLVSIFVIATVKYKHFPRTIEELLFMKKDFDVSDEYKMDKTAYRIEDVQGLSQGAAAFCQKHQLFPHQCYVMALAVEEMVNNIFMHGVKNKKEQFVDLKIVIKEDKVILRIRDNCKAFNPKERVDMVTEDIVSNIGIRMIINMAKKMDYANILNMNYLTIEI